MKLPQRILYRLFTTRIEKRCLFRSLCSIQQNSVTGESDDILDSKLELPVRVRRGIPTCESEYKARKHLAPELPANPHILKVAILGEPNVGKSTLTNALVKWKVCAVSKKVHTTRRKAAAIFVEDEKQIVFLDTPGFITPEHSKKHKLEVSLVVDPENSVRESDLIAVVVDASNKWTNKRIHEDILEMLNSCKEKTSILILNKIDAQKNKQELLNITRALTRGAINGVWMPPIEPVVVQKPKKTSLEEIFERTEKLLGEREKEEEKTEKPEKCLEYFKGAKGWAYFSKVFMISALHNEGIEDLRNYFLASAKPGEWMYHSSNVIDKHPYEVGLTIVREVLLEDLAQEIPYSVHLKIKNWEVDALGCLKINIAIYCPKPHYKRIILGRNGRRIGEFVEKARQALQDAFRSEVYLKLGVE